jgi:hypothetical protein
MAVHYARSGWLRRLARGIYLRPDAQLQRDQSLLLLQDLVPGLHVGGKPALDWHGVRHYVAVDPKLHLYGVESMKLPTWFTDVFPAEYHRKRLLLSDASSMKHIGRFETVRMDRKCRHPSMDS